MARGKIARARRNSRRAALRKQGAQSSPSPDFTARLDARQEARDLRAIAALAPEAFADGDAPACSDCGHSAEMHANGSGPCTMGSCECESYASADTDGGGGDSDGEASVEFVPSADLLHALRTIVEAKTEEEREYVRFQLTDFTLDTLDVVDTLPVEHQPGERTPEVAPGPAEPEPAPSLQPMAWSAILAPEGKLTSDRRAFAPGAITWRELPLTLMAMIETSEGGHVGAMVAGRIDEIWRDETAGLIRARGMFDPGDYGVKIAGLVEDGTLRGNSVDLAIGKYVTGPRAEWFDEDGNWAPTAASEEEPSLLDLYGDDTIAVILEAEIGMSTVCPFPAFAEARIEIGDSLVAGANPALWTVTQQGGFTVEACQTCAEAETLIASASLTVVNGDGEPDVPVPNDVLTAAAEGLAPLTPPAAWFANPELDQATAITIDDDGRIYGHAAVWNVCHIGFPNACRTAPHSKSGYTYFHLGEVVCDNGERVPCGQITLDTDHADLRLDRPNASAHYDHTGSVVAHVCVGEDEHGIWVAGAILPDAPAEKVRLLRGSKLSGDWRSGELVALLAVNVPGFPIPRAKAALAASGSSMEPEVVSLVAAGIPVFDAELSEEERERFEALRLAMEFAALGDAA